MSWMRRKRSVLGKAVSLVNILNAGLMVSVGAYRLRPNIALYINYVAKR